MILYDERNGLVCCRTDWRNGVGSLYSERKSFMLVEEKACDEDIALGTAMA